MRRRTVGWLALALTGLASEPASAQRHRLDRPAPRGAATAPRPDFPGLPGPALRPRGDGIIHWNTPNKDGNLGGPGAGGSSGS